MVTWHPLTSVEELEQIKERSYEVPCVIFKHSTRCGISAAAKLRLEDRWPFAAEDVQPYFLDLLKFRPVSNQTAELFQVHHESPQLLLIRNGECVYEASHMGIRVDELREQLDELRSGRA